MYTYYPYTQVPIQTVGTVTTKQVFKWAIPIGGIFLGLIFIATIWVKYIDPRQHRKNLMRQRNQMIALAYYDVIKKEKSGKEAQKWLMEQFAASGSMYEDPLYDVESVKLGTEAI